MELNEISRELASSKARIQSLTKSLVKSDDPALAREAHGLGGWAWSRRGQMPAVSRHWWLQPMRLALARPVEMEIFFQEENRGGL
jgi:hypothetical protein